MGKLIRAELDKILGNAMLVSFTLFVFPAGALTFVLFGAAVVLLSPDATVYSMGWANDMVATWHIVTQPPASVFSRIFFIAFFAANFAGEYEWDTWKNIVPHSSRIKLVLVKIVLLSLLPIASLFITSLIWGAGAGGVSALAGVDYPPRLTGETFAAFITDYTIEAFLSFILLLIYSSLTALAVFLTRSMVGGLLTALALSILESLAQPILFLLGIITDFRELIDLYAYTPAYNIDNLRALLNNSAIPSLANVPGFAADQTLVGSAFILVVWLIIILGSAVYKFSRQDIS